MEFGGSSDVGLFPAGASGGGCEAASFMVTSSEGGRESDPPSLDKGGWGSSFSEPKLRSEEAVEGVECKKVSGMFCWTCSTLSLETVICNSVVWSWFTEGGARFS